MRAMQTRSVRIDADALRLAERTFAQRDTTFSRFVRDVIEFVARTGSLPALDASDNQPLDERMLAFERRAEELTLSATAEASYASAPVRDLLGAALEERYG